MAAAQPTPPEPPAELAPDPEQASYCAFMFGKALGPWQARRALAWQDAIDGGGAAREWDTGRVFAFPGVELRSRPVAVPMLPGQLRLAQALAFHDRHGSAAMAKAEVRQAAAADPIDEVLWGEILEELRTVKAEALRADRQRH